VCVLVYGEETIRRLVTIHAIIVLNKKHKRMQAVTYVYNTNIIIINNVVLQCLQEWYDLVSVYK
jgi:hypothetical protein